MKNPLTFLTLTLPIMTVVIVSACTKDVVPVTTYGPLSATGTLIKAENSLIRRGTHILIVESEKKYYVESRTQNMTEFEGQTVNIEGALEANTSKSDLPVIVAMSVKRSHGDEDLHRFEIPSLNLRIGVPQTWAGFIKNNTATFTLPGEENPLLTIRLMSGTTLPPGGSSIFLKNRRGTRISGQGNVSDIYILEKDSLIEVHFDPTSQKRLASEEDTAIIASQFERALGTISFLTDKETATKTTESGAVTTCGGAGGVLCPSGYFCNITDLTNQVGQCKERR